MADKYTIKVKSLSKHFNGLKAVDNISFSVAKGEIFGLLGPNGAGKTTTISILATILSPSSCEATVCGYDVCGEPDNIRRCIGIVFQDPSLDEKLTARENLDFHARMYNIPGDERKKRIKEVLAMVKLSDRENSLVETFSGGMRRRLEIARGLMHKPKVLFLDEPTLGLDPQTRQVIRNHILELKQKYGVTIILTTHYMDEADKLCDRIAIIDHGKIIALDTSKKLKASLGGDLVILKGEGLHKIRLDLKKISEKIKEFDSSMSLSVKDAEKAVPRIMRVADKNKVNVESISMKKPTLDDVFLHYTGRSIREEKADKMFMQAMRRRRRMR
jgi:ABC-2 type transport system ATP-binding protein